MHSTQNWFGISKRRPWWGGRGFGEGRRPEWTQKSRMSRKRTETVREQHREGGGAGEREGKGNSKENREKKNEVGRFRSKWFRSPRKGIGEEPRPFSVLSQLGWGRQGTRSGWGRGHVGCLGGFALDCSGVRPHQGAPTQPGGLGSRLRVSHCSGDQRPLPPLSPLDCLSGETGGLGGAGDSSHLLSLELSTPPVFQPSSPCLGALCLGWASPSRTSSQSSTPWRSGP
jgi:hypothetical protein